MSTLDNRGRAPLHWAAMMGLRDVAKTLMQNGSAEFLEVQDGEGDTPDSLSTK